MAKYFLAPICVTWPDHDGDGNRHPGAEHGGQPQIDPGRLNAQRDGIVDLYADRSLHPINSALDLATEHLVFPAHKLDDPGAPIPWDIPFRSGVVNRELNSDYMIVMTGDDFRNVWAQDLGWEPMNEVGIENLDGSHAQSKSRFSNFLTKWNHQAGFFRGVQ